MHVKLYSLFTVHYTVHHSVGCEVWIYVTKLKYQPQCLFSHLFNFSYSFSLVDWNSWILVLIVLVLLGAANFRHCFHLWNFCRSFHDYHKNSFIFDAAIFRYRLQQCNNTDQLDTRRRVIFILTKKHWPHNMCRQWWSQCNNRGLLLHKYVRPVTCVILLIGTWFYLCMF